MKKKVISLIILMFLLTGFIASVQSVETKRFYKAESDLQLPVETESYMLESITIGTMTALIKDQLGQLPINSRLKERFEKYIEKGINEMNMMGITSEKSFVETQTILSDSLLNPKRPKTHMFLMNLYPDSVDITTMIPTYIENLTGNDWQDNTTVEIFVKLIPLFDSIDTSQRVIIRKLHQTTSLIYPAIGARIRQDNSTLFIAAFGPGIKWSWRLF